MNYNWTDKTILVVEDVEVNFALLKVQLRRTKAQIVWLKDGQEAVDYIQENKVADVILMDVRMPIMNGIEATKIIKQLNPNIPIIIQTACVIGNDFDNIENSGCDDYLFKPIISSLLYGKIERQFTKEIKE